MKLLRIFGIGEGRILSKNCSTAATVTSVQRSYLYVIKKPVRLYIHEGNTQFSHFITFSYMVDNIVYQGKRFILPHYRCPQKGERIQVFYDPKDPQNYACYAFGPNVKIIGW